MDRLFFLLALSLVVMAELSKVAGQQRLLCTNRKSPCFFKILSCPSECPQTKPADPKAKACLLDCNSPKCEAVCRNRIATCHGTGSGCYDPRFVGGDGVVFYFHGKADEHFSLVSDTNFQINARFIGRRPQGRTRDFTWIQSLSLMYGTHSFTFGAKKVAKWDNDKLADQFLFSYDGELIDLPEGHLAEWSTSELKIERTARINSVMISLFGIVEISANVVPVTEKDDRAHGYRIALDGHCFAHLEVQFRFFNLSQGVEGVVGQTYQPEFWNPAKRGVIMPIVGGENKYRTSSLLSPDCKSCIFNPETSSSTLLSVGEDEATMVDCTLRLGNGAGIVCRR